MSLSGVAAVAAEGEQDSAAAVEAVKLGLELIPIPEAVVEADKVVSDLVSQNATAETAHQTGQFEDALA